MARSFRLSQCREAGAARHEAEGQASRAEAMVAHLKLVRAIRKCDRKLLDRLELQLEELAASAIEDETPAQTAVQTRGLHGFAAANRCVVLAGAPAARADLTPVPSCPCCGGKLIKLREDITEWCRGSGRWCRPYEKFTCRSCEKITQPAAENENDGCRGDDVSFSTASAD